MIIIEIKNLHYEYTEKVLFEDFNYIFRPGINLITGPNGTGKSTLLNIVAGNLRLDKNEAVKSGTIKYNYLKREISSDEFIQDRLKYVGYIFQEEFLIDSLTFEENLFIPLRFLGFSKRKRYNLYSSQIYHELEQIFPNQKEEDILTKKAGKLSGGEKKKLSILRAIIYSPKLLLIDEPTNHIDSDSLEWFVMLMKKLSEKNITIIMITHSIEIQKKLIDIGIDFSSILELPFNTPDYSAISQSSEQYIEEPEIVDNGSSSNQGQSYSNSSFPIKQQLGDGIHSSGTTETFHLDKLTQNSLYDSTFSKDQAFENVSRTSYGNINISIDFNSSHVHTFYNYKLNEDQLSDNRLKSSKESEDIHTGDKSNNNQEEIKSRDEPHTHRSTMSYLTGLLPGPPQKIGTEFKDKTKISSSQNEKSNVEENTQQNSIAPENSKNIDLKVKLD